MNKNLSDMGKELENIGQVTNVGDLPEKLTCVEEAKAEVEGQLLERVRAKIDSFNNQTIFCSDKHARKTK